MENLEALVWICIALTIGCIASVIVMFGVILTLREEVTNQKYVKVEKLKDGGWSLKTRDGKSIFEL
jgi:hypothetical protein